MAEQEPDRGPKFVWNFPLVRRFQRRDGILSLGAKILKSRQVQSNDDQDFSNTTSEDTSSGSDLENLEEQIGGLETSSDTVFEQSSEDVELVEVTDGGFNPQELNIDTGETVEWQNTTDETVNIISTNNTKLSSGELSPGETYQETLYTNTEIEYVNDEGDQEGIIIVGNPGQTSNIDPVPLNSMSQAASEKDDDDRGF